MVPHHLLLIMATNACPCLKSELDLFEKNFMQLAIENSAFIEVQPVSSISQRGPIEFLVSGSSSEKYIDPSQIFLHLKAKIVKRDGTSIPAGAKVTPINYILNTAFASMQVSLNDRPILNDANYAYKAYLESLLFTSRDARESYLTSALFFKDTEKMDDYDPSTTENAGLIKRNALSSESKEMDLIGKLHFDLGQQSKLLINGVNLKIKFERAKDSFCLLADKSDYKLQILEASLYIRKVQVSPSVIVGHAKALEGGNIQMNFRRSEVKSFTIGSGVQSHSISNVFLGEIPSIVVLGLVGNQNFNGHEKKNPFNFVHANLNYICLRKDGITFPTKPYSPIFDKSIYARNYFSLFTDLNKFSNGSSNIDITYDSYSKGFTFYCYDLTSDFSGDMTHTSPPENSNLSIEMKFSEALQETMTLIVYYQIPVTIQIDKSRSIFTHF